MIKIIVDSEEVKQQLLAESEYIHYLECIDSDKANSLMHLYVAPQVIVVDEDEKDKDKIIAELKSQLVDAARYGYEYHQTSSFPELKFDEMAINNFKQKMMSIGIDLTETK